MPKNPYKMACYYLMKPWDPPEENLYPVLDDLLDDWMASFRPLFEGIRVLGLRWSPKSHERRDFLARNGIPYQRLGAESDKEAHYFIFFTHISQYFSIREAPSTSNKAS